MDKIYGVIDSADIADGSKALYKRQIKKLYDKLPKKTFTILKDVPTVQKTINEIYTNKESQKTMYNAVIVITRLYKGLPNTLYEKYRKIRDELKGEIKEKKSDNVVEGPNKWMSLDELRGVPTMIQREVENRFGSLFLSKEKYDALTKPQRIRYVRLFLKWGFIYIVINYPLRLDYFNLPLSKTDANYEPQRGSVAADKSAGNYMLRDGDKLSLYLNKFKNVKSMGAQTIEYDDPMILYYLDQLEVIFGTKPTHLMWQVVKDEIQLFSRKEVYSHHITNIIKKYTSKHISNNTIRKIWETELINSPEYRQMTNKEKNKAHKKLLHSTSTANEAYNKVHKKMRQMKLCKCCGQVVK